MNKKANIIELNGRQYDAITGRLLAGSETAAKVIDGFVRPSIHAANPGHHHSPEAVKASHQPKPKHASEAAHKVLDIRRTSAPHAPAHQPERAHTLMRHAVERPHVSLKRRAKAVTHTGALLAKPTFDILPKLSADAIDKQRLKRAEHITKSKLISRFGSLDQSAFNVIKPQKPTHLKPTTTHRPTITPNASQQASTAVFERALARANSHTEPYPRPHHAKKLHRTRQITSVAASSLAILLIIGFITYQNAASIQLRIASSRAGISATMPKWHPTGFAAVKFTYAPGTVVVAFRDNNGPSDFSLAQTATNWDSSTLLNDFVSQQSSKYGSIETNGRLVYTYGNNNATWVDGGIWYTLTSNGTLSTTQLLHIANST